MGEYEKIKLRWERDRRVARITLASGTGNVLTIAVNEEIRRALAEIRDADERALSVIALDAEGPDFSYGASVQEHRRAEVGYLFKTFHQVLRDLNDLHVPTAALVRGRCLGGGLELAAFCDLVFCEETATLGLPEIKLGVFPPVGSALLARKCGAGFSTAMVLSGDHFTGTDAHRMGLAYRACPEGFVEESFDSWVGDTLLPLSASSLRMATRAARLPWVSDFFDDVRRAETLYLESLLETHDANEGINAFLEKRAPLWQHGRMR